MKDTLLRPTSTFSQPGSIISDGDIRRRSKITVYSMRKSLLFISFSNHTININWISWSTSMVYWTPSSFMGFLSNTWKIRTSIFIFFCKNSFFYCFIFQGCCYWTSFSNRTRNYYCWRSSFMYVSKYSIKYFHKNISFFKRVLKVNLSRHHH